MDVGEVRERAAALADAGGLGAALDLVRGSCAGAPRLDAAALRIEEGSLLARQGQFDDALAVLQIAESLALESPTLGAEARVMRASILGGCGRFEEALPILRRAVRELQALDAPDLLADARAELRAFENLTSPKHLGTWASILGRR